MELGALAPYETALRTAAPLDLRTADGDELPLAIEQWLGPTDAVDATVLDRCAGPVLDVGCGPGRFVSALHARGIFALGVDIAETAVALTRDLGMPALLRSVFAELPGEGYWPTALLLDGNIGIGGDPLRLLTRIATLLASDGRVIVETAPDPAADQVLSVRFAEGGVAVGPAFDWAVLGVDALARHAATTGYSLVESWSSSGRTFAVLGR